MRSSEKILTEIASNAADLKSLLATFEEGRRINLEFKDFSLGELTTSETDLLIKCIKHFNIHNLTISGNKRSSLRIPNLSGLLIVLKEHKINTLLTSCIVVDDECLKLLGELAISGKANRIVVDDRECAASTESIITLNQLFTPIIEKGEKIADFDYSTSDKNSLHKLLNELDNSRKPNSKEQYKILLKRYKAFVNFDQLKLQNQKIGRTYNPKSLKDICKNIIVSNVSFFKDKEVSIKEVNTLKDSGFEVEFHS